MGIWCGGKNTSPKDGGREPGAGSGGEAGLMLNRPESQRPPVRTPGNLGLSLYDFFPDYFFQPFQKVVIIIVVVIKIISD